MNSNKDWTDKLPDLFEGYTEVEPEGLWDAVSSGIRPKKKRPLTALWYAGSLLAAAAVIAVALLLWPVSPSAESGVSLVPGDAVVAEVFTEDSSEPAGEVSPSVAIASRGCNGRGPSPAMGGVSERQAEEGDTSPADLPDIDVQNPPEMHVNNERTDIDVKKAKPHVKIQACISRQGQMGQKSVQMNGNGGMPSAAIATKGFSSGTFDFGIVSRNKPATTETTHSQSARITLGLKCSIDKKWGVESGITMSTLNTTVSTRSGNITRKTERQLEYMGIPLYLYYNAVEWRRFNIYLTAGPMYEFVTGIHQERVVYMNGKRISSSTDDTLQKDSIWSFNTGAGLQWNFTGHSALFVQPGFSYHFAGGNNIESYYTAHPAAFNLAIGYRLTLF